MNGQTDPVALEESGGEPVDGTGRLCIAYVLFAGALIATVVAIALVAAIVA